MKYIYLGSLAFVLFFLFDYMNFKNSYKQKHIMSIGGLGIFLYALVKVIRTSEKFSIPFVVQGIAMIFIGVFLLALIYSLFLELPFQATYAEKGYNNLLIDTGTYALTRHPGVLWLFLCLLSLAIATGTVLTLYAAIIWTSINSFYVYLQEKLFFCNIFPGYDVYQKTTPMLIPTIGSIQKCIYTLGKRRGAK